MEPLGVLPGRSSRRGGSDARADDGGRGRRISPCGWGGRPASMRRPFVLLVFRAPSENLRCLAPPRSSSSCAEFLRAATRFRKLSTISRSDGRGRGTRRPSAPRRRVPERRLRLFEQRSGAGLCLAVGAGQGIAQDLWSYWSAAVTAVSGPNLLPRQSSALPVRNGTSGKQPGYQPRRSHPCDDRWRHKPCSVLALASQQRVLGEPSARVEAEPAVDGLAVLRSLENRDPGAGLARRVQCRNGERPAEAAPALP